MHTESEPSFWFREIQSARSDRVCVGVVSAALDICRRHAVSEVMVCQIWSMRSIKLRLRQPMHWLWRFVLPQRFGESPSHQAALSCCFPSVCNGRYNFWSTAICSVSILCENLRVNHHAVPSRFEAHVEEAAHQLLDQVPRQFNCSASAIFHMKLQIDFLFSNFYATSMTLSVFSLRWSLVICSLPGYYGCNFRYYVAAITWTQFKKKKYGGGNFLCLLVASIILFALRVFCCYACEGFALSLKFVMRIIWGASGDCFLLDTTTFSTVSFSAIQLSMFFQEGSIAELKLHCMFEVPSSDSCSIETVSNHVMDFH
jgi:hypothetical protein